ncbi:hypothetical protein Leryth_012746 [Lithospermum erythrorhizon]|nr:hypothetical protein Leryth_012746 [Lithospermum erythrorhizon]
MEGDGFRKDMLLAVQYGMAEVWLFNGNGNAPPNILKGIVKYILVSDFAASNKKLSSKKLPMLSKDFYWEEMDEDEVAQFLNYCELHMNNSDSSGDY